jgi:hypothetical protein
MKSFIAFLILCVSLVSSGREINLAALQKWYNPASSKVKIASDGVITVTANTADRRANGYQKAQSVLPLKASEISGKTIELSFKYRTEKLDGAVQIALRETSGKGGTYHGKTLKRWDVSKDWKACRHTFKTRKEIKELCLYIVGSYMKENEKVEIKDLKLTIK